MLSKTKMSILLGLTCVSLVGTGFSSWSIRVLKADQLGVITVGGDIVHLDWLSYNVDENTCGISFVYSKNNGVKRFEKQYFDIAPWLLVFHSFYLLLFFSSFYFCQTKHV